MNGYTSIPVARPTGRRRAVELLTFQSMWAMERLPWREQEWTFEEKVEQIARRRLRRRRGRVRRPRAGEEITGLLRERGLEWSVECYPEAVEELLTPTRTRRRVRDRERDPHQPPADVKPDDGAGGDPADPRLDADRRGRRPRGPVRDPSRPDDHRPPLHPAADRRGAADEAHRRPLPLPPRARVPLAGLRGRHRADPPDRRARRRLPRPGRLPRAGPDPDLLPPPPTVARPLPRVVGRGLPALARRAPARATSSSSRPSSGPPSGTRSPAPTATRCRIGGPKRFSCATRSRNSGRRSRPRTAADGRLRRPRPSRRGRPCRDAGDRGDRRRLDRPRMPPARLLWPPAPRWSGSPRATRSTRRRSPRPTGSTAFDELGGAGRRARGRGGRPRLPARRPAGPDRGDPRPRRRDQGDPRPEAAGGDARGRPRAVEACEERGVVLGVNQNMRYDHSIRALKALLDEGRLGEPVMAQITMHTRVGWMPYAASTRARGC